MLTIRIPPEVAARVLDALVRAGDREVGGVLLGEHTGVNDFTVRAVTIHRRGGLAFFVRRLSEALHGLQTFFSETSYQFTRFNYLGEWHSHPLFPAEPSRQDDTSMRVIVQDAALGATFAVLLVLKLDRERRLTGSAHTYLPDGTKSRSNMKLEESQ